MNTEDKQPIIDQIKISSFFVVAALSPSFLISLLCVFLYLITAFPEIKEPVQNIIANLLLKVGVKNTEATEEK